MRKVFAVVAFCACATVASAQVGELSVSGGVSRFGKSELSPGTGLTLGNGFRLAIRFTLNTKRFMGHEFGYGYAHSSLSIPGSLLGAAAPGQPVPAGNQSLGLPVHQGFYDFLIYATPEGSKVRPFACGGAQFSSFFPPGTSVYYGNQQTKFGINYGGGIKFRVTSVWGVRFDVRQYASGKPDIAAMFGLPAPSGWMRQTEASAGVSFNF